MNVNLGSFKVVGKKAQYNQLPGELELSYDPKTTLTLAEEDAEGCPPILFDFVKLDKLGEKEPGSQVGKNQLYTICVPRKRIF